MLHTRKFPAIYIEKTTFYAISDLEEEIHGAGNMMNKTQRKIRPKTKAIRIKIRKKLQSPEKKRGGGYTGYYIRKGFQLYILEQRPFI
jgi:hypothetical protein